MVMGCKKKPTGTNIWSDIDNERNDAGKVTTDASGNLASKYDSQIVFKKTAYKGNNPVVVANDNKVVLAFDTDGGMKFVASHNGGLTVSSEKVLDGNSSFKQPHVFFDGTTVTVLGSIPNYTVDGIESLTATFKEGETQAGDKVGDLDKKTGWLEGTRISFYQTDSGLPGATGNAIKSYLSATNESNFKYGILSGRGLIEGGTKYIPIYYSYGSTTYGIIPTTFDGSYLKPTIDKASANDTKLSGDSQKGKFGIKKDEILAGKDGGNLKKHSTKPSDAGTELTGLSYSDIFETAQAKSGNKVYVFGKDKLYRYDSGLSGSASKSASIGNGTTGGSVAVLKDGSILTFTKETEGLVLRRFTEKYFESKNSSGSID